MKALYPWLGHRFGLFTAVKVAAMMAALAFLAGVDAGGFKVGVQMALLMFVTVLGMLRLTVYVIGPVLHLCMRAER